MPESDDPLDLVGTLGQFATGIAAHERFVREMKEIDRAHHTGRLREWVEEKLQREREAMGVEPVK